MRTPLQETAWARADSVLGPRLARGCGTEMPQLPAHRGIPTFLPFYLPTHLPTLPWRQDATDEPPSSRQVSVHSSTLTNIPEWTEKCTEKFRMAEYSIIQTPPPVRHPVYIP